MITNRNNFNKINRLGHNPKKFIYGKKIYANPFFRRQNAGIIKTGVLSAKSKLFIFALAVIMIILVWLLFFSRLFKIEAINVSGAGESRMKEIETIAWGVATDRLIGKNNLLLYNKSDLIKILNEKYYLKNLTVTRKLFHALNINLLEKQPVAIWREAEQYYYIDSNGYIINQTNPLNINGSNYPLIENLTAVMINGRRTNIDKEMIDYILNLFNEFKEKKHNFEVERFIVDQDVNTVKMAILSGPKIYFNTKASAAEQITKLNLIIKDKLNNDFKNIKEYIDLRYANNVYIK